MKIAILGTGAVGQTLASKLSELGNEIMVILFIIHSNKILITE